jgi:hypothetical protein
MGDTANRTWGSRDLEAHLRQEQATKERAKDWLLACTSAEFAFRLAEQGHNLDYVYAELAKVFNGERRT